MQMQGSGYARPHDDDEGSSVLLRRRSIAGAGGAGSLLPVITLSESFLKLLHTGKHSAYSLSPVFASRVEVFTTSMLTQDPESAWRPAALLVSQDGLIYLFDAVQDGMLFNVARLTSQGNVELQKARRAGKGTIVGRSRATSRGPGGFTSRRSQQRIGEVGDAEYLDEEDEEGEGEVRSSKKARVDIIIESVPRPAEAAQCLYIRCRDTVAINSLANGEGRARIPDGSQPHSIMKGQGSSVPASQSRSKGKVTGGRSDGKGSSDTEDDNGNSPRRRRRKSSVSFSEMKENDEGGRKVYGDPGSTPFSYIFRFHSRNAELALQFASVVRHFTSEASNELSLKRVNAYLEDFIPETALADPFVSVIRRSSSLSRSSSAQRLRSLFSRGDAPRVNVGGDGEATGLTIADVAKAEKKRLAESGVKVMIPPPIDPSASPPRPRRVDPAATLQLGSRPTAALVPAQAPQEDQQKAMQQKGSGSEAQVAAQAGAPAVVAGAVDINESPNSGAVDTATATNVAFDPPQAPQIPVILFPEVKRFVLTEREDVLKTNGLLGFESQSAVFAEDPAISLFAQQASQRLLSDQGMTPAPPFSPMLYDSYIARAKEIAREEVRGFFGACYVEHNTHTRKAIAVLNLDSLILNDQKDRMEARFKAELSALRENHDKKWAHVNEKEGSLFFRDNQPYYRDEDQTPVKPVSEDEARWKRELTTSSRALKAVSDKIAQLKRVLYPTVSDDEGAIGVSVRRASGTGRVDGSTSPSRQQRADNSKDGAAGSLSEGERLRDSEMTRAQQRIASEAERLLEQVYKEETSIRAIQKQVGSQRQARLREIEETYNGWVEQQQEEIDALKDRFVQLSEFFGLHPSLAESPNSALSGRRGSSRQYPTAANTTGRHGTGNEASVGGDRGPSERSPIRSVSRGPGTRTAPSPAPSNTFQPSASIPSIRQMMMADI